MMIATAIEPKGNQPNGIPPKGSQPNGDRPKKAKHKGMRTCVGCGARVERRLSGRELVRLVLIDDGDGVRAVVDPTTGRRGGDTAGRGAWTHPRRACVTAAVKKGLSRSAKQRVSADVGQLLSQIHEASQRRVDSLLAVAVRSRKAAVGTQAVVDALRTQASRLLIVATDAAAAVKVPAIASSTASGGALPYGDKACLGAVLGRDQVAVIAITDDAMAQGVREAIARWNFSLQTLSGDTCGAGDSERQDPSARHKSPRGRDAR